ncbi:hypothetical protein Pcinc_007181 [Petrolisthes cinctipes]|uniref:Uncharacterized protein n=1 Tax=Petrolisthes cinctipes TaxID=88211 RepID=A0AAE1GBI3_PETCI|nr:hypothetical protein Pcinc_007181 [Petrolisthes cinctipes]
MGLGGGEQQLRFRWNDHTQHLAKVLTLQRLEERFCDATLVSDDGFVMKAHQAVLASTSAYFRRALAQVSQGQHPTVVLRGANAAELSCILDYMYQGNTQVEQRMMEGVLAVADMLEVKGLSRLHLTSLPTTTTSATSFSTTSSSTITTSTTTPVSPSNTSILPNSTTTVPSSNMLASVPPTHITATPATSVSSSPVSSLSITSASSFSTTSVSSFSTALASSLSNTPVSPLSTTSVLPLPTATSLPLNSVSHSPTLLTLPSSMMHPSSTSALSATSLSHCSISSSQGSLPQVLSCAQALHSTPPTLPSSTLLSASSCALSSAPLTSVAPLTLPTTGICLAAASSTPVLSSNPVTMSFTPTFSCTPTFSSTCPTVSSTPALSSALQTLPSALSTLSSTCLDLSMTRHQPPSPRENQDKVGGGETAGEGDAVIEARGRDESEEEEEEEEDEEGVEEDMVLRKRRRLMEEMERLVEERERGVEEKEREVEEREKRRSITLTAITTVTESGGGGCQSLPQSNGNRGCVTGMGTGTGLVRTLEVPCEDGPLTISLTTGLGSGTTRGILARHKPLSCPALAQKRVKRKGRVRRSIEDSQQRGTRLEMNGRTNTRALDLFRKSEDLAPASGLPTCQASTEQVSVNCDLSFPDEDNPTLDGSTRVAPDSPSHSDSEGGAKGSREGRRAGVQFPAISPMALFSLPPAPVRGKQRRTSLTLEQKVRVIEAHLGGRSQRQIAAQAGVGKTQVSGILRRRAELLAAYRDSLLRGDKVTGRRRRRSEYQTLNQHLIQWYRHMTAAAGVTVTTGMLRAKALQLAPQLGHKDFRASNGWLATFKANHNLKFSRQRRAETGHSGGCPPSSRGPREVPSHFFEDEDGEATGDPPGGHQEGGEGQVTGPVEEAATPDLTVTRPAPASQASSSSSTPGEQVGALIHPGLAGAAIHKPTQMVNASLGANLTAAAAAYTLTRDLSRDLGRDPGGPTDLAAMNPTSLNHPVPLNVARAGVEAPLAKPPDPPQATYKSEETGSSYPYDPQARLNDPARPPSEYNYTHYGFPGGYYGAYHFLGQY